jgi:hypothetical protein
MDRLSNQSTDISSKSKIRSFITAKCVIFTNLWQVELTDEEVTEQQIADTEQVISTRST